MNQVIFTGAMQFALLGVGLAILMLLAGNIGVLMSLPLLLATGLLPEQAIPISLLITAALMVPGALDHLQSKNVDKKFVFFVLLGVLPGVFVSKYMIEFINLSYIALFTIYLLLLIGNFIYHRKPFPILPRPNNPTRKRIVSLLKKLPGKTKFTDSGIKMSPVTPVVLGFMFSIIAVLLGPVAAMLFCPVMVVLLEVPVFMAIGTVSVINILSFVTLGATSGMMTYPVILQILLWMFLGVSLTYTFSSYILGQRKLHPLPLAIVFLMLTSITLL